MEINFAIIGLIVSVLNIILFFKLWKATNDIAEINNKVVSKSFHRLFVLGRTKEAHELLLTEMYDKLFEQAGYNEAYFNKSLNVIINEYTPRFAALGEDLPDEIKSLTFEKWRKGFV